ncbi:lymphocyte antigen 96 isoform 2-T2 [Liasis olivaceus]
MLLVAGLRLHAPGLRLWQQGAGRCRAHLQTKRAAAVSETRQPFTAARCGLRTPLGSPGAFGSRFWLAGNKQVLFPHAESLCRFGTSSLEEHSEFGRLIYSGNLSRSVLVPGTDTFFFSPKPCWLRDRSEWQGTIFWIPKADLTVVHAHIRLWNGPLRAFEWESIVCHGVDDDYSYCGTLKGETINTTTRISGSGSRYLKFLQGEYTVSLEVFSGLKELITCVNYTLILK